MTDMADLNVAFEAIISEAEKITAVKEENLNFYAIAVVKEGEKERERGGEGERKRGKEEERKRGREEEEEGRRKRERGKRNVFPYL